MITDKDARELVKTLRRLAKRNVEERNREEGDYWKGQGDGRHGAYNLAAVWLEALIPDGEAEQ